MSKLLFTLGVLLIGIGVTFMPIFRKHPALPPAPTDKLGSIVRLVQGGRTFCSGTVVSDHVLITAAHCMMVETPFGSMVSPSLTEIRANDNVGRGVQAIPVYIGIQMDQAMLTGDFSLFEHRPLITNFTKLTEIGHEGQELIACGYPLGGDLVCSRLIFKHKENFYWAVDGALYPGMSGGPVMVNGTLVGVNTAVDKELSIVSPIYNLTRNLRKP